MSSTLKRAGIAAAALALPFMISVSNAQTKGARSFETPEMAVEALVTAGKAKDRKEILSILGPETEEWLITGDDVQNAKDRDNFLAAYDAKHSLDMADDNTAILYVGEDDFPFPFPVVKLENGWSFDAEEGREELLDRRIGENELNAMEVIQAIADAQTEYASVDWDEDGMLEYASRFASTEGNRDGLYWPQDAAEYESPLGELVAKASAEGYTGEETTEDTSPTYHGYRYKLIYKQGESAPGGAREYIVDDNEIGGFAILAFPANYNTSGIMTFMTSAAGKIYEKDLGPDTEEAALAIDSFDPDSSWREPEPEAE